ncbi:cohesin domain-containing protein [Paenibacillus hexagrammi]|uniref:Cohesin domain-containing protein n=2 Tax=Paenibacillus hexagrammi TaxID=2908839 RepID=A0ABY3SDC9_9BACL|nr:immunoglobulin-like domain-containing protein [Paenibacillus sp. YPD9-1]UJF31415.1 cohesin domain-containing protein [Paenibacillus sp. YPD9-1]
MGLGGTWNNGDPVTAIGDYRWMNYKASADVSFENNSTQGGANYAAIGARYQGGGSSHTISGTPYVLKFWFDGGWQLLVNNSSVANGNVVTGSGGVTLNGFNSAYDAWHNIAVQVAGDEVTAYLDGVKLASYTDPSPKLTGRVDLASGYYNVRFDNLKVETVDGYAPYYSEHLDDLEMNDLAAAPAAKLMYSGAWSHQNGQGMYVYQRSISTSQGAGAALTYTFTGTGLDILGANDGSAKLEVTVDGQVVTKSAPTMASKEFYQTYTLRGLSYGEHTVQLKVISGTLNVDSVGVVSGEVKGAPDTAALGDAVTAAQSITRQDEFNESDWNLFEAVRGMAQNATTDPASYRLDQEGANQLAARLTYAQNLLFSDDVRELASPSYAATYVGTAPNLPQQVSATLADGSTKLVSVKWELDKVSFDTPYQTVAVTGTYGNLKTVCYVEVVPENMKYFVDLNATASGLTSGHSTSNTLGYASPAYTAIEALVTASGESLLNNAPDQIYNAANGWGHGGYDANGTPSVSYKGIVSGPYSKQSTTGIYTANQNGAAVTYTFDNLPAGDFTLTLGSYSWWSSNSRTEQVVLEHDNQSDQVDTITLDSSSYDAVKSYTFTMADPGKLTLKLVAAQSNQSPMLSFVGVAQVKQGETVVDKTELQALYDAYKGKENDGYDDTKWTTFQDALANALSVLNDESAAQETVGEALAALQNAVDGLQNSQEPDTVQPVITLVGDAIVHLENGAEYTDAGATAADNQDGDITSSIVTSITRDGNAVEAMDTSVAGTYTYHYNVGDAAGNTAAEVTRTVIVAPAALKAELHGPSSVMNGQSFDVTYGFNTVSSNVYAQDVTISYDPQQLEFVSASELSDDWTLLATSSDVSGKIRIIAARIGSQSENNGDLFKLSWKSKTAQSAYTSTLSLTNVTVADGSGAETGVEGTDFNIQVTVIQQTPGDLNSDSKFSIGDLALVASYYGKTSNDENWTEIYKNADMNNDGVIDIADIAAVARLILQN